MSTPTAPPSSTAGAGLEPAPAGRTRMSPRRRARISRSIQYSILIALVLVFAVGTDWADFADAFLNPTAVQEILPRIPAAFLNTLVYTAAAFAVGLSLGLVLALMKLSSVRPYRWIATTYIEFFRGIPALLVVVAFGYAVPVALGITFDSIILVIALALGMVASAYIAETIRAGLQAVPKGQVEAARSLGMSHPRTMATVVIPQAFRIILPPMTNEIILLTKDTSLIYVLGLLPSQFELTKLGRDALNSATGGLTALIVIGAAYLLITIPLGILARSLERRSGGAR